MTRLSVVWTRTPGQDAARLVRDEVSRVCGVAPDSVRLARMCPACGSDRHGRLSVVPWSELTPPSVGLSRSPGLAVAVVASAGAVGVDVEEVASFADAGLRSVVLHPQEQAIGPRELATTWVRKEALLKAAGCGLAVDPSLVRMSSPRDPAAVLDWPERAWAAEPGWLMDLEPAPGFRAAVAGSGRAPDEVTTRTAGPEAPLG